MNIKVGSIETKMLLGLFIPGLTQKVSVTFANTLPIYDYADDLFEKNCKLDFG
ncbi:hypothetical protein [Dyadobacter bucti]|uniref:hypothetical protein n=1 Tax=Dyadobacter bucti TaxID=2572203 RepID=UPI003F71F121